MPLKGNSISQATACGLELEILPRRAAGEISNPKRPEGSAVKMPYEAPRLKVYGDIIALTKGNGKLAVSLDGFSHILKT